jgi:uncharacterized protein
MSAIRVITIEEHFHHPPAVARVRQILGAPPPSADDRVDREAAEHLGTRRLAHMDRAGIDVQVVSHGANSPGSLDHPDAVGLCRDVNDALAAQISRHPDRFRGFATLPLHDPAVAADEFGRCVEELGFVGALVMGTCGGRFLDDKRFAPVLAAAERADLPIYVHPGVPGPDVIASYYTGDWSDTVGFTFARSGFGWHVEAGIHVLRLILSGALDRHPRLKLISGHWGEFVAGWLDRLDERFDAGTGLAGPVSEYYRRHVWITPSGIYDHARFAAYVSAVGADRIIHSEDFPYLERDDVADVLDGAGLDDDQRHAIAHRNAEDLLRI